MECPRCKNLAESCDRFCGRCGYNLSVVPDTDFQTIHAGKVGDVQFDLGVLYFQKGRFKEALEIFEQIEKENPDNLQVIIMCERTRDALKAQ